MYRHQSNASGREGHELGAQPLRGSADDRVPALLLAAETVHLRSFIVGKIEIEEHEDASFRIDAQQPDGPTTQTAILML